MSTVLYELTIPALYDIVRARQTNSYTASVNYHVDCDQSFSAIWPSRPIGCGQMVDKEYADHFYCPVCGERLDATQRTAEISYCSTPVPTRCKLSVVQRPGQLDLQMTYDSVLYDGDFKVITKGTRSRRTDIIRFDFRKRSTEYIRKGIARGNVVNTIEPFFSTGWSKTPFGYLQLNHTSYLEWYGSELADLVSVLKKAFKTELDKRIGYSSKPILQKAVKADNSHGALGGLLDTLAWRMVAPDAPAFTERLRNEASDIWRQELPNKMRAVTANTVRGESWVNAFMDAFGILPSRINRRAVTKRPFLASLVITLVQELTDNVDYARRLVDYFSTEAKSRYGYDMSIRLTDWGIQELIQFVKLLKVNWGEKAAMDFILTNKDFITARDTAVLYSRLHRAGRKALWDGPRIKLRDLHDQLSTRVQLQDLDNIPVQLSPRHTMLRDTIGGLAFIVPASTVEIATIGAKLNNCVRTYCDRVKDGKTAIVEVRKGERTIACLQVSPKVEDGRFSVLAQAKLKNNMKVSTDHAVNDAVVAWAKKHKLTLDQCMHDVGGVTA